MITNRKVSKVTTLITSGLDAYSYHYFRKVVGGGEAALFCVAKTFFVHCSIHLNVVVVAVVVVNKIIRNQSLDCIWRWKDFTSKQSKPLFLEYTCIIKNIYITFSFCAQFWSLRLESFCFPGDRYCLELLIITKLHRFFEVFATFITLRQF